MLIMAGALSIRPRTVVCASTVTKGHRVLLGGFARPAAVSTVRRAVADGVSPPARAGSGPQTGMRPGSLDPRHVRNGDGTSGRASSWGSPRARRRGCALRMIGSGCSVPCASGPRRPRCRPVHVEHRPRRGRPPPAAPVPSPDPGDRTSRQRPTTRVSARSHRAERAVRAGSGAAAPVRRAEREAATPTRRPAAPAGPPPRRGRVRGRNAIGPCTTPVGIASTTLGARIGGTHQRMPGLGPICRDTTRGDRADCG